MSDDPIFSANVEKQLEGPMPWIGMYVATASLICTLAITADAFRGFRRKRLWFPTKFFSVNATSLTLLAVSMKLPMDLTTRMYAPTDRLAKVSSLVFISTAMGNFMTCLGTFDEKEILMNVTALGILVITVVVNVCVQIIQMRGFLGHRELFGEEIIACVFMLFLLVMLASTAVMVPTTKRYLESKYHEMLKLASDEQFLETMEEGSLTFDRLRIMILKYWVMAETSRPQFVIARSVTCTASGILCLLIALVLAESEVRMWMKYRRVYVTASSYGWSIKWIVLAQSIGVGVGTIAPAFRWFVAAHFKFHEMGNKNGFRDQFKIDAYWIQRLVEWKESSLPLQIRNRKWRKFLHHAKGLILNFVIKIQILIVLNSKLIRFLSFCFAWPIISLLHWIRRLRFIRSSSRARVHGISELELKSAQEIDLTRYVLLLEGEVELPQKILTNIRNEVDQMIETGKNQKPKNLIKLLQKVGNFQVLSRVDRKHVPNLLSQELPKCWSLSLVTLASIAIALPNIPKNKVNRLLEGMDEGLLYVKLVEKTLDKKGNLKNSRKAADVIWVGVELYRTWQDKDLYETSLKGKDSTEILQELSMKAERTVLDFRGEVNKDFVMENPLNWPVKVIAATSMYRVCQILLIACEGNELHTDEGLFEQIAVMIANITAACLTNLLRVIIMKCRIKDIKKTSKRVHEATLLLGETEEILRMVHMYRATELDPDESAFVDKWCNLV